ncbi:B12-binding domain-containing radical SAM protein [Nitrospirota bacterium]
MRRVLLVNPNQYQHPPVMPLAIEYLAHTLTQEGIEVKVLDLCFSEDIKKDINSALDCYCPDAVGVSVRNVDSVLYPDTEFFLPLTKEIISTIREYTAAPIIIGGSAMSSGAEDILEFLGADIAIHGPGEKTLANIINHDNLNALKGKVIQGETPQSQCPKRVIAVDPEKYISGGGIAGFETHKGCSAGCTYCIESDTRVVYRNAVDVVQEIKSLVAQGMTHLHLCDSEFNENLELSTLFLKELINADISIKWAVYMRVGHYNEEMFRLLKQSGAYLVTLSVDTLDMSQRYWDSVREMIDLCKGNGIDVAVDLLAGFPEEQDGALKKAIDHFREVRPKEVVINTTIRLAKTMPMTKTILENDKHSEFLINANAPTLLEPVFYRRVTGDDIRSLANGDKMFRVAGESKGVNYQFTREEV